MGQGRGSHRVGRNDRPYAELPLRAAFYPIKAAQAASAGVANRAFYSRKLIYSSSCNRSSPSSTISRPIPNSSA